MPRHDQYGTHDEKRARTKRSRAAQHRDEERAQWFDRGGAAFRDRDYGRENYGGGDGAQHRVHSGRPAKGWRGQVGGDGLDGLASERAFGSDGDRQNAPLNTDYDYRRWRDEELAAHDEEYREWRRRQAERYDAEYARWKSARNSRKDRGF